MDYLLKLKIKAKVQIKYSDNINCEREGGEKQIIIIEYQIILTGPCFYKDNLACRKQNNM